MDHNVFFERLKIEIENDRDEQKEHMAQGYATDDYQYRVGRLRGMDDVVLMGQKIIRSINNGEE